MGSEDLGGGWKANFKLEAGYNLDNGTGGASNTNNQVSGGFTTQSVDNSATATTATGAATINSGTGAPLTQDRASMGGGQGLTFNRWSYAGLSNAAVGEFRVGREYTPTFQAVLAADMVGSNGVQNTTFQTLLLGTANSHATTTSASNGISYESPRMSGFGVKVQAFFGENPDPVPVTAVKQVTGKSGDGSSYHASYVQGPISAGFGAQTTKGTNIAASAGVNQIPGKYDVSTAYARYDFGVAIAAVAQVTEEMALSTGANENKSTVLGLRVPMGAITLNANYTTSKNTVAGALAGKATQMGLQALYAMSKRTDLYINYAVTDNGTEGTSGKVYGLGNGAGRLVAVGAAGDKSTAYQIGMRHNF